MSPAVALAQSTSAVLTVVARLAGLAVLAGVLAGSVALVYRWYVRERVPEGLALLVALAGIAVVLNTTPLLAAEIDPGGQDLAIVDALFNIAAFVVSTAAGFGAIRVGDRLGTDVFVASGSGRIDADVSEIVQTVGRVTRIELPDEIDDVVGYDPVPDATRETLEGQRFLFPRRLTKVELRDRLVSRLKTDYGVGHVDVEFGDDGAVEYLAIGSRAAGIGPTLPSATNAVAIRADPAHAASAGDLVQVWETDPTKRVLTGELRGVSGDVVTVAIDAADTPRLSPTERYKLVTLPVGDRPDREFASLLRAADETLATVTVEAGSDLDGATLQHLDVTVAAVTREDEATEPLPRSRTLRAGDVVYAIATPDRLRKLEGAASGRDEGATRTGAVAPNPSDASNERDALEGEAGEPDAPGSDPNGTDGPGPELTEAADESATSEPAASEPATSEPATDETAGGPAFDADGVDPLSDPLDGGGDETDDGSEAGDGREDESGR